MAKPAKSAKTAKKAKAVKAKRPAPKKKALAKPAKAHAKHAHHHAERFDRSSYEIPVMDLGEAILLATSLLAAKPARPTPAVAEEVARVAGARTRAQAIQQSHGGKSSSVDARAYDAAMDRAWETFVRRIEDHIELPADHHGDAPDAAKIYAIVSDLSILKLNYLAEFAQIGARLDALKREGLLEAARPLAGDVFVDEVLRCHAEYGQALGVMGAPAAATSAGDRGEARNVLIEAIAEYAVQLMGEARAGRPESWAPVDKALRPIVELRAHQAKSRRAHATPRKPAPHPPHPPVERAAEHAS